MYLLSPLDMDSDIQVVSVIIAMLSARQLYGGYTKDAESEAEEFQEANKEKESRVNQHYPYLDWYQDIGEGGGAGIRAVK